MGAKFILGSYASLAWAVALLLFGFGLLIRFYSRSQTDRLTRWLAAASKSMGLLLLAICLLEPLQIGQRARPGSNLFVILADNSQSLTMKDPGATETRGQQLQQILNSERESWQTRLAQDFDVRRFVFDSTLKSVADFSHLEFERPQSNLIGVLNGVKDRFRDRPLAGVLIFTDGIATDTKRVEFDSQGSTPIYPVVIGKDSPNHSIPDLAVSRLTVATTAFEDAPVTIQADVSQSSLPKSKAVAQVLDESGVVLKQETQTFADDRSPLPFRFQIRPTKPGLSFYEVRVRNEDDSKRVDESKPDATSSTLSGSFRPIVDPQSIESTLANNRRLIAVDRGNTKYRILYLSGRPNWEYKFIRRAVEADEQIGLTAVIRVAKKEPKFALRSKDGEVNNPLFRGFDRKTEETERYDQPVLVRLNTKSPDELREGFPKTAEELFQFHAIVIDDLESEFFSPDQFALLERFVADRGGGLLMLGGAESFRQGGYDKTAVSRLLPIYLDAPASPSTGSSFRLGLTRDGWLQPWARLRSTETEEQLRLSEMPNFFTMNRVGRVKPGATVVAEVTDSNGQKIPALAVQTFGRGRSAAMTIGDLWRWQVDRSDAQRERDELGKTWRQTLRWLIADVPDRIELRTMPQDEFGNALMKMEARIRTKEFQPQDNAVATVSVRLPDGTVVDQPMEPSLREAGLYETMFATRQPGCYRVTVEATDGEHQPIGLTETGWAVDPIADEFARVTPDVPFLEDVARRTSGELVPINGLDAFVQSLPNRKVPLVESYSTPLWHQSWVLAAIMICLCAEWGLRRWKGLP